MKDKLKDIPGFPNYQVTCDGRVWSNKSNRWLISGKNKNGYLAITIQQAKYTISLLVALAWIGPKPKGMWVLHKDDNKQHNHYTNLYYGTAQDNANDAIYNGSYANMPRGINNGNSKLTEEQVIEIKQRLIDGESIIAIARLLSVTISPITAIYYNITWKHIPWPREEIAQ